MARHISSNPQMLCFGEHWQGYSQVEDASYLLRVMAAGEECFTSIASRGRRPNDCRRFSLSRTEKQLKPPQSVHTQSFRFAGLDSMSVANSHKQTRRRGQRFTKLSQSVDDQDRQSRLRTRNFVLQKLSIVTRQTAKSPKRRKAPTLAVTCNASLSNPNPERPTSPL